MQAVASGPITKLCYRSVMVNKLQARMALSTAAVLGAIILVGCRSHQPAEAESDNVANESAPLPSLPVVEPPFNRTRLLLTVARAASSHSVGADDANIQRTLDGKQFEVRLRFGCGDQGPGRGDYGWSVDPDGRTLRLRAVPTLSLNDEMVRSVAGEKVEAAEGFWLSRPWLLHAACPATRTTARASAPTGPQPAADGSGQAMPRRQYAAPTIQRIGIAQFFTVDDPRTGRRIDRPFEAVKQLKEGESIGNQGFNLVLAGRLRARDDGRVILCAGNGRDRPPDCIVSADVDRVWIERPEDKAVMAEWSA